MVTTTGSEKWHLVILWLAVTSAAPFVLYAAIPGHPYKTLIGAIVLFALLSLFVKGNIYVRQKGFLFILTLQLALLLSISLYHDSYSKIINISLQVVCFIVLIVYAQNFIGLERVCKSFIIFMSVMAVLGGAVFFLAASGILNHVWEFPRPGSDQTMYSYVITFTNVKINIRNSEIIRYSGYFDEPGRMGFYLTYSLILNKLYYEDSRYEYIIIFFGLLTLSLAFAISVFIYLLWFYGNRNNAFYFLVVVFLVVGSGWYVYENRNTSPKMDLLSQKTVERVLPTDRGDRIIRGDNRSEGFISNLKYLSEKPILGYGPSFYKKKNLTIPSSFINVLVKYGLLGGIVVFAHIIYIFMKGTISSRGKKAVAGSIILLGANYLQRPQVAGLLNFLVLYLVLNGFLKEET